MGENVETDACAVPAAPSGPFPAVPVGAVRAPTSMETFRARMLRISRSLNGYEVAKIKFLLKDLLPRTDLEGAKEGFQLFDLLQRNEYVNESNLELLVHLLAAINHRKLAREMNNNVPIDPDDPLRRLDSWKVAMLGCSDDIGDDTLNKIKFLLRGEAGFSARSLESASSLLDLVVVMEERGTERRHIVEQVQNWLKALGRPSFNFGPPCPRGRGGGGGRGGGRRGRGGREFAAQPRLASNQTGTTTAAAAAISAAPPVSVRQSVSPSVTAPPPRFAPLVTPRGSSNQFPIQSQQFRQQRPLPSLQPGAPSRVAERNNDRQQPSTKPYNPDDMYDPRGKGLCVIVNNKNFYKNDLYDEDARSGLGIRTGTEADEEALNSHFSQLGYDVYVEKDKTAAELRELVNSIAKSDLSQWGALVFIVLSHGKELAVYGSDGIAVGVNEIKDPFGSSSCCSMAGKPKVFLFQACQGESAEFVHVDGGGGQKSKSVAEKKGRVIHISDSPNFADFYVGYAAVQGFESYRTDKGTWFIDALCNNIYQYAYDDAKHFHDIFVKVTQEVTKRHGRKCEGESEVVVRQTPLQNATLRKDFYLRRRL